jgi:drug/metabolite transporter (DMT)-like permease
VRDPGGARLTARGVVTAAVAGCGFGGIVLAFNETPADSGMAPLVVARLLQAVLLGTAAVVAGIRTGGSSRVASTASAPDVAGPPAVGGPVRRLALVVVACGVFDALANVFIQTGLHSSTDPSTLPVISVLNALYPIGTVLLAGIVLRERLAVLQAVGIGLALTASVTLALA